MKCLEIEGISVWEDISDLWLCVVVVLSVDFNVCDNFNVHASDKISWLHVSRVIVIWSTSCQRILRKIRIIECEVFTVKVYLIVSVSVCGVVWFCDEFYVHVNTMNSRLWGNLSLTRQVNINSWLVASLSESQLRWSDQCSQLSGSKIQIYWIVQQVNRFLVDLLVKVQQINSSLSIFYGTVKPGILSRRK